MLIGSFGDRTPTISESSATAMALLRNASRPHRFQADNAGTIATHMHLSGPRRAAFLEAVTARLKASTAEHSTSRRTVMLPLP